MGKFAGMAFAMGTSSKPATEHNSGGIDGTPSAPPAPAAAKLGGHHAPGSLLHAAAAAAVVAKGGGNGRPASRYGMEDGEDSDRQQLHIPSAVVQRLQSAPQPAPAPALPQQHASQPGIVTDSGTAAYARLASRMIAMVNELRSSGVDVALELPTVIVCGQQSAGKSSVVEAICGVPLPRSQETCTRCPTELRLCMAPPPGGMPWEAAVKLRRETNVVAGGRDKTVLQPASGAWQLAQYQQQQQQQQMLHVQKPIQPQGGNAFSPMSTGMVGPHGSQPSTPRSNSRQPSTLIPSSSGDVCAAGCESIFRAGITNPAELPVAVAAAQAALLQHTAAHRSGLRTSTDAASGTAPLKFSRDVVVVEVRGAPADLTLIDLPGIIHAVERPEDDHYKHLVAELAAEYMRRPGTVIVATVTCKEDIDTQVVLSMAREADPQGERTLGVLTKPDQVEEGCHGQWLQVLAGDRWPLSLGWYVVRNPNQAALARGTSAAAARQQEEVFFGAANPWARLPAPSRARLGSLRLREAMSQQLVRMATAARPALMASAQAQLVTLRAQLAALPPAAVLSNGHAELMRLIDDASSSIQEEVAARSHNKHFYQQLLCNFQALKSALASARPCFLLPCRSGTSGASSTSSGNGANGGNSNNTNGNNSTTACASNGAGGLLAVTCALDDDLAAADDARAAAAQQLLLAGVVAGPGCVRAPVSFDIFSATAGAAAAVAGTPGGSGKPGLGVFVGGGSSSNAPLASGAVVLGSCPQQVLLALDAPEACRGMSLEEVRCLVERHHSIELPGFSPYSAIQDLVSRHQATWPVAVAECTAATHRQLLQLVLAHVSRSFSRFPRAEEHVRELATELLEELHGETSAAVEGLVAMELSGAFAVCRREFGRASAQQLEGLRTLMAGASLSGSTLQPVAATGVSNGDGGNDTSQRGSGKPGGPDSRGPAIAGQQQSQQSQLSTQPLCTATTSTNTATSSGLYEPVQPLLPLPATATGPAELLAMMAAVLAYYGLSCRRLSDTAAMAVSHHLVTAFSARFRSRLTSVMLGLPGDAVAGMLVEDGACAAQRATLQERKDLLEHALRVMRAAG